MEASPNGLLAGDPSSTPKPHKTADWTPRAAEAPSFLRPPQAPDELGRLGGFRILRELGQGGMGWVFVADDVTAKRQVAMKVMRPEFAGDAECRARFLREAQAAARLQSDYIVPLYQVGEDNGVLFLVMPLLTGYSLASRLAAEPKAPVDLIRQVGREVAEGLAAAHSQGLLHRDIKPANLWLDSASPSDRVKILDFGLAQIRDEPGPTRPGTVLGTPGYMAPEQIDDGALGGAALDGRCDLFSLGCVLYRMATGAAAFHGTSIASIFRATSCASSAREAWGGSSWRTM
jgi:serine/threonine protein kinase